MENPAVLALQILWFRNHNWHADRLRVANLDSAPAGPAGDWARAHWTDERLFLEARKWNVAEYQHVAIDEWLPVYVGQALPEYSGYKSTVNPGVADVFQAAAHRFGHSLVPSAFLRRDALCNWRQTNDLWGTAGKAGLRVCNTYSMYQQLLHWHSCPSNFEYCRSLTRAFLCALLSGLQCAATTSYWRLLLLLCPTLPPPPSTGTACAILWTSG